MAIVKGNTRAEILEYFETVIFPFVTELQTFITGNETQLIQKFEDSASDWVFFLERMDKAFVDTEGDHRFRKRMIGFWVLKKSTTKMDYEQENQIYDEAEQLVEKILTKIIEDRDSCVVWQQLNINDIQEFDVGPVMDNRFGQRVMFPVLVPTRKNLYNDY